MAPGAQYNDFAEKLKPFFGFKPEIKSLADLFTFIYKVGQKQKILVVIDEFPYLLPTTETEIKRELSSIQAVLEDERDKSQLKLILCGSLVGQMESLLAEGAPLYGRLRPLQFQPMAFQEARLHVPGLDPLDQFARFALAGGIPRYLATFSAVAPLRTLVMDRILNPNAALWDEGRAIVEQELREPKIYFTILQELAGGDKESGQLTTTLRSDAQRTSKYLKTLEDMRLVERLLPMGSDIASRGGHWHLRDPFLRFWFRFVFPFQDDLEAGLSSSTLFDTEIAPTLNEHVGRQFEDFCLSWTRRNYPITKASPWWGNSLNEFRENGSRSTEEIDIVGMARGRVIVVGEVRWRNSMMDISYLNEIQKYKIPALKQSKLKLSANPTILLFCLGGYTKALQLQASKRTDLVLVDVRKALSS